MRKGFKDKHNFQENHPHLLNAPQKRLDYGDNQLYSDKQSDSLFELVDAITNLFENQIIQRATLRHKRGLALNNMSFDSEKVLLGFKDFVCHLCGKAYVCKGLANFSIYILPLLLFFISSSLTTWLAILWSLWVVPSSQ